MLSSLGTPDDRWMVDAFIIFEASKKPVKTCTHKSRLNFWPKIKIQQLPFGIVRGRALAALPSVSI
jgi:hypothetical protein